RRPRPRVGPRGAAGAGRPGRAPRAARALRDPAAAGAADRSPAGTQGEHGSRRVRGGAGAAARAARGDEPADPASGRRAAAVMRLAAVRRGVALLVLLAGCGSTADATQLPEADAALREGRYDQAIEVYRTLTRRGEAFPLAARGLARALSTVGRYDEAEAALRTALATAPDSVQLANALGEVLYARGEVEQAERLFRAAAEGRASDSLLARLNLGVLLYETGRRAEALDLFDTFIDVYNSGARLDARELMAVGIAVRYLGVRDPQLYKDALRALDEAVAADSGNLD